LHAGGEELLDGQVVQIPADPGPLIEQRGHLLGVLGVGQLTGQRHGALVEAGHLATGIGQLARELLQLPVDLSTVVAAHRDGKLAVFLSHVGFLLLASWGRSPPGQA